MPRCLIGVPALIATLVVGCGGGSGTVAPPAPRVAFDELAEVIKTMHEQKVKPPAKLADLHRYEPMAEAATLGLKKGDVVYLWGAGYKAGGTAVVAHAAAAPTQGGWVLLEDGTVKEMTAAEFGAAPKAGKK